MPPNARYKDWGEWGPAMRALTPQMRLFVECYLLEPPTHRAQTRAALRAGSGTPKTTSDNMARIALRLMRNDKVIGAVAEEAKKIVRAGAPEASKALLNLLRDPTQGSRARYFSCVS